VYSKGAFINIQYSKGVFINVQCLARRYNWNYYQRLERPYVIHNFQVPSSQEDEMIAMQIMEVCGVKCDFILDSDEGKLILHYLCCN